MTWDQLFDKPGPKKDYSDDALGPILRSDAALLGALMNYIRPRVVVEYGSLDGHSAAVLATFAETLYCIEADGQRPGMHHVCADYPNVVFVGARMQDWTPPDGTVVDVVYVDASHVKEDSLAAYRRFLPYLRTEGLIICHDTATWVDHPSQGHRDFQPTRDAAVKGERDFVTWLREVWGWHPVALGCPTAFRHGLTILQRQTGWNGVN